MEIDLNQASIKELNSQKEILENKINELMNSNQDVIKLKSNLKQSYDNSIKIKKQLELA